MAKIKYFFNRQISSPLSRLFTRKLNRNNGQQKEKIQLPLENWVDLLAFVPRRQLVSLFYEIKDHQFVSILQYFLDNYAETTLKVLHISAHVRENANRRPILLLSPIRYFPTSNQCVDVEMPRNLKNFDEIILGYFNLAIMNFLQKFQQKCLFVNVNLSISSQLTMGTVLPVLAHVLPLVISINCLQTARIYEFIRICEHNNHEYSQLVGGMLENARILHIGYTHKHLLPGEIDWLCSRWLIKTARRDAKPRVLFLQRFGWDGYCEDRWPSSNLSLLIDRIKQDFLMAKIPATFFVHLCQRVNNADWEDICLENGRTNERLVIKKIQTEFDRTKFVLVSRYAIGAVNEWIELNEAEVLRWEFATKKRQIRFERNLKIGI